MLPASNRGVGGNVGFPDVCMTPPYGEPIPYTNTSLNATAATFSPNVCWTMMNALNLGSVIPTSTGDEPGTLHWTRKGPAIANTGSPIVFINGLPARHLCNEMDSNSGNNQPCVVTIPSATNVFLTYAPPGTAGLHRTPGAPAEAGAPAADPFQRRMVRTDEVQRFVAAFAAPERALEDAATAGAVGYLKIGVFSSDLAALVFSAVRRLEAQGMRALVVDLRDNPGGELSAFLELAGDFLEPGAVLAVMIDEDGDELVYRARPGAKYSFPVVVLVGGGTASAAELFAGCLKAHRRATVVGARTYGKGVGQLLRPAADGVGFACSSVARFVLPHGERVDGVGVRPDVEVSGAPEVELDQALAQARILLAVA